MEANPNWKGGTATNPTVPPVVQPYPLNVTGGQQPAATANTAPGAPVSANNPQGGAGNGGTSGCCECSERSRILFCGVSLLFDILSSFYLFVQQQQESEGGGVGIGGLFVCTALVNVMLLYVDIRLACTEFKENRQQEESTYYFLSAKYVSFISMLFTEAAEVLFAVNFLLTCGINYVLLIKTIKFALHVLLEGWELFKLPAFWKALLPYLLLFGVIGFYMYQSFSSINDISTSFDDYYFDDFYYESFDGSSFSACGILEAGLRRRGLRGNNE